MLDPFIDTLSTPSINVPAKSLIRLLLKPLITTPSKPPFLFRTASDDSRGINTIEEIDPLHGTKSPLTGREYLYHTDVADLERDPTKAQRMFFNHIKYNYQFASEFSSWSASLLYVLVHASRKKFFMREKNVLVYIMDTRKLPISRVHNAHDVLRKYRLQCYKELDEYVPGEFLVHGRLTNRGNLWQAVSLENLISAGLWKAFPALMDIDHRQLLISRVRFLRRAYFVEPVELSPNSLSMLCDLAECFGESWKGPVLIALIGLRQRDLSTNGITQLTSSLHGVRLPQLPWSTDIILRSAYIAVQDIPEAKQFMQLLQLLNIRRVASESEDDETVSDKKGMNINDWAFGG